MRTRIAGKPGSRKGRVSKKAPNEPKKVRKDFRRENGSTQGGFLPRKVAFCSLSGKKQKTRNKIPVRSVYIIENQLFCIFLLRIRQRDVLT